DRSDEPHIGAGAGGCDGLVGALPTQRGRRGQGPDGLSGAGVAGHTERGVDVEAADDGDGAAVHRTPSERATKVTATRAGPVSRPAMGSTRPATPRRPLA